MCVCVGVCVCVCAHVHFCVNMQVQQCALYHLIKGQAELLQPKTSENGMAAVQSLQMAKNLLRGEGKGRTKSPGLRLSLGEQVLVYVELARAHTQHQQQVGRSQCQRVLSNIRCVTSVPSCKGNARCS